MKRNGSRMAVSIEGAGKP